MKKKFLRIISLILCLSIIGGMLAGCSIINPDNEKGDDESNDKPCPHKYGEWYCEDEDEECQSRKYYKECEKCGDVLTKKGSSDDHKFGKETILSSCEHVEYTYRECENCGKEDIGEPTYNDISFSDKNLEIAYDDEKHWIECTVCHKTSEKYEHDMYAEHENDGHRFECPCGFEGEKVAHVLDENGNCTVCDYLNPDNLSPLAGTYDIVLWVSEMENYNTGYSVVKQTEEQIEEFMAANPGVIINATVLGVTEADAASQVINDIFSAPDIYCFPQDQFSSLVMAGALSCPADYIAEQIVANNDTSSLSAVTVGGKVYAYPMTSDTGYYLYYDKSVITNPDSLEDIIADCTAAYNTGRDNYLFRYGLENGWYTASFFFATGCRSEWIMNGDGQFTAVNDDFNSEAGLIAMKGMQKLTQSVCYDPNNDYFNYAAAVVTGVWNANAAEEHFGENLGVADLPSFTVDGKSYHLSSFSGNKLMGVKPQSDAKREELLHNLAAYLTGEECQMERYNEFNWGPSNLNAQQSPEVKSNPHLSALFEQSKYAVPQGRIHGAWWDIMASVGAETRYATSDSDLEHILNEYENEINSLFDYEKYERWSMIGSICDTMWDEDLPMTEVSSGVWQSEVLYLNRGEEFKFRYGENWVVQIGANGQVKTPSVEPANIVVETTGVFVVQLEWDGVSDYATITFIPFD